jgi:drug/metabolite transporter (DMT)-like permease
MPSKHRAGVGLTAVASAAGAPSGLLVRLLRHAGPWSILLWRTVPYLGIMAVVWTGVGQCARIAALRELRFNRWVVFASLCLAAQSIALVVAVLHTTVANVTCVQQLAPVFCAIGDRIAGEILPWRTVGMIMGGLIGIGVIFGGDVDLHGSALGLCIALGNPLSWAVYWYVLRRKQEVDDRAAATTTTTTTGGTRVEGMGTDRWGLHSAGTGAALEGTTADAPDHRPTAARLRCAKAVPYLVISGAACGVVGAAVGTGGHLDNTEELDWLWYTLFGGVCLPIAQLLFTLAPQFIPTAEIACVKMIEVVLAPLFVYLYDSEAPTLNTYIGGGLIVASVLGHSVVALRAPSPVTAVLVSDTTRPS